MKKLISHFTQTSLLAENEKKKEEKSDEISFPKIKTTYLNTNL